MDTRKFLLILTVVVAVYVTVSSATQSPPEQHDNKAVQLADDPQTATSDKNVDDTPSTEEKTKAKPKRKNHGKKNHRNHARTRTHGGRNRTRSHHKNHRHGSKDKSKKNQSASPLPHEETAVKMNTGENKRQERNHNKKEKNNKNRSRTREGRNRNHNHNNERDGNHASIHPVQNDASFTTSSINDPVQASIYQTQNYNHNLVGHSTKTSVKHEPTKATGSTASN